MRKILTSLIVPIILISLSFDNLNARNKITYRPFEWNRVEQNFGSNPDSGSYILYWPKRMDHLYPETQAIIDEIYEKYSRVFADSGAYTSTFDTTKVERWYDKKRVIVVYPSLQDFAQSRLIYEFMSPGILGLNETIAWRVGVPFPGSYILYKNVMYHELAHAWMFQLLRESAHMNHVRISPVNRNARLDLPLWFVEGFAELLNRRYNQEFNASYLVIMRETMMREQITDQFQAVPSPAQMAGMDVYSFGFSFVNWVVDKYGFEKIIEYIVKRPSVKKSDKPEKEPWESAWKQVFGKYTDEMAQDWAEEALLDYYKPYVTDSLKSETQKIVWSDEEKETIIIGYAGYSNSKIAYYTPDDEWGARVEVKDLLTEQVWNVHHMFDKKALWYHYSSPPAIHYNKVAISINKEGQDELHIYKLKNLKTVEKGWIRKILSKEKTKDVTLEHVLREKDILSIKNPSFNDDGTKIVFEGIGLNGFSDIYVWHLKTNNVEQITHDIYYDAHPNFIYTNLIEKIVFTSDRLDSKKIGLFSIEGPDSPSIYLYQPDKPGISINQPVANDRSIAFRVVSLDHSPQIYLWHSGYDKIYHVFSTFYGISQIVGWIDDKTLLLINMKGELIKFTLDDFDTYQSAKRQHISTDDTLWTADKPDSVLKPLPELRGRNKYKYIVPTFGSIGLSSATGEEIFTGSASLSFWSTRIGKTNISQLYYHFMLNKLDLRERLQKQYTFTAYKFYGFRFSQKYPSRTVLDNTIRFDATLYWPFNLENGIGMNLASGWLEREYTIGWRWVYDFMPPYKNRTDQHVTDINSFDQGWRLIKISNYNTGMLNRGGLYFIHDALFSTYGEVRHGSWLVTQINLMMLNKNLQEGQFFFDGRYYIQINKSRALLANRAFFIKSLGKDRQLNVFENYIHKEDRFFSYRWGTDIALLQTELRFPILNWIATQIATAPINSWYGIFAFRVNGALFLYAGNLWFGDYTKPWDKRGGLAIKLAVLPGINLQYEYYKTQYGNEKLSKWKKGWFLTMEF